MPLYIIVSEGPSADQAVPLLAIADQRIVDALLQASRRRGQQDHQNLKRQQGSSIHQDRSKVTLCSHNSQDPARHERAAERRDTP